MMKFCVHCGNEMYDEAVICVKCGRSAEPPKPVAPVTNYNGTMCVVVKVLLVLSCIAQGWLILPLAWCLPITLSVFSAFHNQKPIGTGLKVCTLLLVNMLAGICLLCMNDSTTTPGNGDYYANQATGPVIQLKTNRGLLKVILLSFITFGIYGLVVMSAVSTDINTIAERYDGKKTMHYCLVAFIFSWLTLGIVPIVWCHRISNRIGNELYRRGIAYSFSAGSFWGWNVLGSIIVIGPFIYLHKMLKSMNLLAEHYNVNG